MSCRVLFLQAAVNLTLTCLDFRLLQAADRAVIVNTDMDKASSLSRRHRHAIWLLCRFTLSIAWIGCQEPYAHVRRGSSSPQEAEAAAFTWSAARKQSRGKLASPDPQARAAHAAVQIAAVCPAVPDGARGRLQHLLCSVAPGQPSDDEAAANRCSPGLAGSRRMSREGALLA